MSEEIIKYQSEKQSLTTSSQTLANVSTNGLNCVWSGKVNSGYQKAKFSWSFNWDKLKEHGVNELSGHIVVHFHDYNRDINDSDQFDVKLTESPQVITRIIDKTSSWETIMEYCFAPCYKVNEEVSYDEMFLPSEENDAILVIEEKKLHVSKKFLSYHSDYFRALFSSNYKEGQMDEIPIKDVSYNDIALLLSTIHPQTVFPNGKMAPVKRIKFITFSDITVEKLLTLADRFLMPSVILHVEYHLLNNTKIDNGKLMWLADEYGMQKLLDQSIRQINSIEKIKELKESPLYAKLSNETKARILDRLMLFL